MFIAWNIAGWGAHSAWRNSIGVGSHFICCRLFVSPHPPPPRPHPHTVKNQYRKLETNIPRKWIARPQSQFPHSRERNMGTDPGNTYVNRSQSHECGNRDRGRAIPRKGIHKCYFPCSAQSYHSTYLTSTLFFLLSVQQLTSDASWPQLGMVPMRRVQASTNTIDHKKLT